MMIAIRVVVVTSLLLAALLIQSTVDVALPIDYLYATAAITYVLTLAYIALIRFLPNRRLNIYLQLVGDLFVETMIVYFTGGIDSPFSSLYLVTIITASMLLYRRGGLIIASGAAILYGTMVDLMYYRLVPLPGLSLFSSFPWSIARLYLTIATNFAGFYATALLSSYISEKLKQTFEELDANRQNLAGLRALNQSIIESIPSGLITTTSDGVATFINPSGCSILGSSVSEVIGRRVSDIGVMPAELWAEMLENLSVLHVVRGESDVLRFGEPGKIGFAITTLMNDRASSSFMIVFQDLTEMKQLEEQLRLKDRMAAVGELSAGIAHEIRNPLAAIAGSVQLLRKSQSLTEQEQRLMSIVLRESDRLNKSIEDFLRFVRPHERLLADFDIATSLDETLTLLSNSPEVTASHQIKRRIDPPSFRLFGDPDQIRQVFWNVARNAIQAMTNGGTLSAATTVDEGEYRISFSDEGSGMSENDQRRLFQPFRTGFPSGTGLGMAISYRIVQSHGGRIDVDSREGRGTTITIALPLQQSANNPGSRSEL